MARRLYAAKMPGMSTPLGQGMQYRQPVQPTFMFSLMAATTLASTCRSASDSIPGWLLSAVSKFSRTMSREFMPESTQVTSF